MLTKQEIDQKIQAFYARNRNRYFQYHNTYYMYTEDMYGNITSERYGVNLMTDNGFQKLCRYRGYPDESKIWQPFYIGTGTTTPTFSDTTLGNDIAACNTYMQETETISTNFDTTTGIIYQTTRVGNGYFDYIIENHDDDLVVDESDPLQRSYFPITEVGIGPANNDLYFRFLIMDQDGNPSMIKKYQTEKLYFHIYHTWCLDEDVMLIPTTQNKYVLLNPYYWFNHYGDILQILGFLNDRGYNWLNKIWTFNVNHGDNSRFKLMSYSQDASTVDLTQHTIKYSITIPDTLIEDPYVYVSNILMCSTGMTSDITFHRNGAVNGYLLTLDKLSEPEQLISEDIYTNSTLSDRIDEQYGYAHDSSAKNGALPVTNFIISSLNMFNVEDNDFTINEEFSQNTNYDSNQLFLTRVPYDAFMCPDGIRRTVYIFQNTNPTLKIKSFTNTGITIFAADKGWDVTTWTQINNLTAVDDALSQKPYYISYTNTNLTYTYADDVYPQIIPMTEPVDVINDTSLVDFANNTDNMRMVGDDTNQFFVWNQYIVKLNDNHTCQWVQSLSNNVTSHPYDRYVKDQYFLYGKDIPINSNPNPNVKYGTTFRLVDTSQTDPFGRYGHVTVYPILCFNEEAEAYRDTNDDGFVICYRAATPGIQICKINDERVTSLARTHYDLSDTSCWSQGGFQTNTNTFDTSSYNIHQTDAITVAPGKVIEMHAVLNVLTGNKFGWGYVGYDADDNVIINIERTDFISFQDCFIIPENVVKIRVKLENDDSNRYWTSQIYPNQISSAHLVVSDAVTSIFPMIENATCGVCIRGTDYLVYTDATTNYLTKWYIVDMNDPTTIIDSFEIDSNMVGDNCRGGIGFSHYVYLSLSSADGQYSVWLYDMHTKQLRHLTTEMDESFAFSTTRRNWIYSGNDKCLVFGIDSTFYIIAEDEPDKIYTLYSNFQKRLTHHCLKYINHHKQLIFTAYTGYYYNSFTTQRQIVRDIGYWLKHKGFPNGEPVDYFNGNSSNYNYSRIGHSWCYPYDKGIIEVKDHCTTFERNALTYYPIERFVPHKIVGTTTTINAYNNPIVLKNKTVSCTVTNDLSKCNLNNSGDTTYDP